ncbi:very short patch repair endonuclease [Halomonas mongoliensis]|uniref:very short patch repair endonuclease n=1 Tax=Halomonas mongoliensis TaxID=321265 RepID=UPI00403B27F5
MRAVRQKDTAPEVIVRRLLFRLGLRFRLHVKRLPGSPDIVLRRHSTAIFVHGCYWHRHPGCKHATTPKTNRDYWLPKFKANVERDARQAEALRALGWRVLIVWECETRDPPSSTLPARFWPEIGTHGMGIQRLSHFWPNSL